jgi:hypothetical protein
MVVECAKTSQGLAGRPQFFRTPNKKSQQISEKFQEILKISSFQSVLTWGTV